jgi:hypothetical protein
MEECYLRVDKDFWNLGGRKTIYSAGTEFILEIQTIDYMLGRGEVRHYYVYEKPHKHIGLFGEEEFNEIFMTKDEVRDRKIDEII